MPRRMPFLPRLTPKLVLAVLPAALASATGGYWFAHGRAEPTPAPVVQRYTVASAAMMKMVRDEHALVIDYLNARMAAQQAKFAAQDRASARARAEARTARRHPASPRLAARPLNPREPAAALATSRPAVAVVVAQIEPGASMDSDSSAVDESTASAAATAPSALPPPSRREDSLFARTMRAKDSLLAGTMRAKEHVVTATERVAFAIGGIPNWIAGVGDRVGGGLPASSSESRMIGATW